MDDYTDQDKELQEYLMAPTGDYGEKKNTHTFLHNVATAKDTTKLGYLNEEEIGDPSHPIRTYKNLALIADKIMDNSYFKDFFEGQSEIVTSTSLSRKGKLIELAISQRRQLEDITKPQTSSRDKKGLFSRKKKEDELQ